MSDQTIEYTPEELTPDGLPTVEAQLRRLEERDRELNQRRLENNMRDLKMRVKCLALDSMGLNMLHNTNSLDYKKRDQLQNIMRTYEDKTPEEIRQLFNERCSDSLFISSMDPSKFPMYHV
jgi:hypothetical protein